MSAESEVLYRINDVLTALAEELGVVWSGDDQEDMVLDELTHTVAEAFGLSEGNP